ncbi:MAG: hypothetical protein LBM20_03755 [Rikenellaceae bacterium]|jgi:hypothetical protein|nr:hypothetical protein [Rikenellaceae bacterium]
MKNKFLFVSLLSAAVLFSACKKLDNRPYYLSVGSQENGLITDDNGTILVPAAGTELPMPDGLNRVRVRTLFRLAHEDEAITTQSPGTRYNIEIASLEHMPTQTISSPGATTKNDPIMMPSLESNSEEVIQISTLTPSFQVVLNYVDLGIYHLVYSKNATAGNQYAEVSFALEVDPVLRPDERGMGPDTVYMALKFDNNRAEGETIEDAVRSVGTWRSFDLTRAEQYFPFKDEAGKNVTYIIKMMYNTYTDLKNMTEGDTVEKYLTTTWTPGYPYAVDTE